MGDIGFQRRHISRGARRYGNVDLAGKPMCCNTTTCNEPSPALGDGDNRLAGRGADEGEDRSASPAGAFDKW
ncbi:hypothetical protein [Blastococcus capsensis]|uniref:hypothetical protein n=1 Tax=Blastococcus capsensis TaxID=1564163 RepID=UPI0025416D45|nr:hypothetical protein [Blastococcus capsensis]MDK3255754.1 hypothetical protein [Blastococcus capsensis]